MKVIYWVGVCVAFALSAGAQGVPESFNYQGVLRGGSGEHLEAGSYNVTFKLYDQATGGDPLWGRKYAVLLDTNGLFNVELADGMGTEIIPDSSLSGVIAENDALYLGVMVQGSSEIAPRQQLLSVPFAMRAGDVHEASADFTVHGVLYALDGLEVSGTIQATTSLDVGNEDEDSGVATLIAREPGVLQVPGLYVSGSATLASDLHVSGNATLAQKLDVAGKTTLMTNLTANGSTTLAKLTVNGTTRLRGVVSAFSTNVTDAAGFVELSKTEDTQLLAEASSDGFIIINLWYSIETEGASDLNEVYSDIKFTGRKHDRTIEHGIRINKMDAKHFTKKDAVTLPVLKGETVTWHPDEWQTVSDTIIFIRSFFVPFGMNQ